MPDFKYKGKTFYNPVEFALSHIGGTWKMPILWRLNTKTHRYSELKRSLKHISDKMLTSQLRELEADDFVHRKVYAVVPPKTEYSLTDKGIRAMEVVKVIHSYGRELMEKAGVRT